MRAVNSRHLRFLLRDANNVIRHGPRSPRAAQLLWFRPREIEHYLATHIRPVHTGRVLDGDWDLDLAPVTELEKFKICRKHFEDGLSWSDAGAFAYMERLLERKGRADKCESRADVERRYASVDALYHDLRVGEAFLTQKRIRGADHFRESRGIVVHIGRTGNPIFGRSGNHRFAIAWLLDLDVIPVQVGVVHRTAVAEGLFSDVVRSGEKLRLQVSYGGDE